MQVKILANQIETFTDRMAVLSKKIKKEIPWCFSDFSKEWETVDGEQVEVLYTRIDVELESMFSVDGFTFYALVQNVEGIPQIHSSDSKALDFVNTDKEFKCPHCNKVILNRKNKIFLKNSEGEIVAFGSSCAQKYFGSSYKFLTRGIEYLQKMVKEFTGFQRTASWRDFVGHSRMVDCAIMVYLRGEKYVSANTASYSYNLSTAARVDDYIRALWHSGPITGLDLIKFESELKENKEKIEKLKGEIYAFYKALEPKENFEFNLKNQFDRRGNKLGMVVYGVYKYFWTLEKLAREAAPKKVWKDSDLKIGDTVKDLDLEFVRATNFGTAWGSSTFYNFKDENGSVIVIKVTGSLDHLENNQNGYSLTVGKHYIVSKAKVKDKKVWKDIPQTFLKLGRKDAIREK